MLSKTAMSTINSRRSIRLRFSTSWLPVAMLLSISRMTFSADRHGH